MSDFMPFALPLVVATGLWLGQPDAKLSRRISLAALLPLLVWAGGLLAQTGGEGLLVHAVGGWRPPFGIALVVDGLSALFITLHLTLLGVTLLALRPAAHGAETARRAHPLLWWLTLGLIGAFMTGDLFNLFVMFEIVLVASYLLLQLPGSPRARAAAMPTIVMNLVASLLFLAGLGILYGLCGSVNLADLTERLGDVDPLLRRVALSMLVAAFATKAAVVPLCFWMPATYPTLSAPLAALLAGIMTKLGVYALIRILPLLLLDPLLLDALVVLGGLSALLGVLAALSQYEVRRLLAFHSVSQVGYIVCAIGLATQSGVAAAIFFALHHSLVKSTLYLVSDELERASSSRDLRKMEAGRASNTALTVVFGIAAFSLAGMPPFSGFFGKVAVFRAAFEQQSWLALGVLLIASVFTLASMLKIWQFAFRTGRTGRAVPGDAEPSPESAPGGLSYRIPLLLAASLILCFGLAAGPVFERAQDAAHGVLDPTAYARAVLEAEGLPGSAGGGR